MFKLRDLEFSVSQAVISGKFKDGFLECFIEVDMEPIEKDGEIWPPCLSHQGLKFNVSSWEELNGKTVKYTSRKDADYTHPEIGILYVFGHEETHSNIIEFGEIKDGHISFKWSGVNNVWWDDEFNNDVPFELSCKLQINNA